MAEFFGIISRYRDAPPARSSPLAWRDPAYVEGLLGKAFDLTFEQGVGDAYHGSADHIWDWYTRGFGPLRQLVESFRLIASRSSSATSTPITANTPFRRGCAFGVNIC